MSGVAMKMPETLDAITRNCEIIHALIDLSGEHEAATLLALRLNEFLAPANLYLVALISTMSSLLSKDEWAQLQKMVATNEAVAP